MSRQFTVELTPDLVRRAVQSFWLRRCGLRFALFAMIGTVLALRAFEYESTDLSTWPLVALLTGLLLLSGYQYRQHLHRSLASLHGDSARVRYTLDNAGFRTETASTDSEESWSALQGLWKFRAYWLLLLDQNVYLILPLVGPSADDLHFIDIKVRTFIP